VIAVSDDEHLDLADHDIRSNAGRCDICGSPIDMESGDTLVLHEFGIENDEIAEEHDLDDEDVIEAVADAMQRVATSGEGRHLAEHIAQEGGFRVHERCLDETEFGKLETSMEGSP
jgi:hypothetical protein